MVGWANPLATTGMTRVRRARPEKTTPVEAILDSRTGDREGFGVEVQWAQRGDVVPPSSRL